MMNEGSQKELESDPLNKELQNLRTRLSNLDDKSQLIELINDLKELDVKIDNDLDKLVSKSKLIEKKESSKLQISKTDLLTSLTSSSSLIKILSESSYISKKLIYKIKFLDYQRLRILNTKNYVENIISLKSKILLINESFPKKDWETISKSIQYILNNIPIEILKDSKFANIMIPSSEIPEKPETLINNWIKELNEFFVKEFQVAINKKDIVKLTEFFSYFPMIGRADVGLKYYSNFIKDIINEQSKKLLINAPKDKLNFFGATLMKLFEIISKIINQHSRIITKYYERDSILIIINEIQQEVDSQSGLIVDIFWESRNFDKIIHDINGYNFNYLNDLLNNSLNDPENEQLIYDDNIEKLIPVIEVGDYINEISTILNRWSLYCRFLVVKYNEYSDTKEQTDRIQPLVNSSFNFKINEKLLPCLNSLLTYYLKKSMEKSFKLEELPSLFDNLKDFDNENTLEIKPLENPPISSIIEDLIIISNTILVNLFKTSQLSFIKNYLLNDFKKILNNIFLKNLLNKLKSNQPHIGTNILTSVKTVQEAIEHNEKLHAMDDPNRNVITGNLSSLTKQDHKNANNGEFLANMIKRGTTVLNSITFKDEESLINFVIYLNSISLFKKYLLQLLTNLINNDIHKVELKEIIDNNLMVTILKNSDLIIKDNLQVLFNQIFKNKLRSVFNDFFNNTNYLIDSTTNSTTNNQEIIKFTKNWNYLIKPYYKLFAPEIFSALIKIIIIFVNDYLEKKIWSLNKKITLFGVIKLEKDLSLIINEITKDHYHLRESFIRITQIIMIMGLDEDDNEDDEEIDWILTTNEKKRAKNLRIDV